MSDRIYLEVNGVKYDGFKSLNYRKSIEELSGTFNFVATCDQKDTLPFIGQERCRIVLGDKPLITGFIETLKYQYTDIDHSVLIKGRDKAADIIDSTVVSTDGEGNIDFQAPISLQQIIQKTLILVGITGITVINAVAGLQDFSEEEIVVAKVGENVFDFFDKYARKRGVLLTSNGDGNIVITRSSLEVLPGILVNQIGGSYNNIKAGDISYDFTQRYYKYVVKSQANPSIEQEFVETDDLSGYEGTIGIAFDDEVRKTRVLEITGETVSVPKTNQERAQWEANIRRARSLIYTCDVSSLYSSEDAIYEPNKRIRVLDEMCRIDAIMIIRSVDYSLDESKGTRVTLELVPSDAYSLEASRNPLQIQYDKIGDGVLIPRQATPNIDLSFLQSRPL